MAETNPIEDLEIMGMVEIEPEMLSSPPLYQKFKDVVNFFSGKEDKGYLIRKILSKSPVEDKLDHLWQYVQLRNEHQSLKNEKENLIKEKERIGGIFDEIFKKDRELEKTKESLDDLEKEISIYE